MFVRGANKRMLLNAVEEVVTRGCAWWSCSKGVLQNVVTRGCACLLLLLQPSPPWAADQSRAVAGLPRGREPESCSSLHHDCKLCHTCVTELHVTCFAEWILLQSYMLRIQQSAWNGDRDGKHSSNLNVWCPLMEGLKDQDSVSRTFNNGNISNNFGSKSSVSNIFLLFYQSQLI